MEASNKEKTINESRRHLEEINMKNKIATFWKNPDVVVEFLYPPKQFAEVTKELMLKHKNFAMSLAKLLATECSALSAFFFNNGAITSKQYLSMLEYVITRAFNIHIARYEPKEKKRKILNENIRELQEFYFNSLSIYLCIVSKNDPTSFLKEHKNDNLKLFVQSAFWGLEGRKADAAEIDLALRVMVLNFIDSHNLDKEDIAAPKTDVDRILNDIETSTAKEISFDENALISLLVYQPEAALSYFRKDSKRKRIQAEQLRKEEAPDAVQPQEKSHLESEFVREFCATVMSLRKEERLDLYKACRCALDAIGSNFEMYNLDFQTEPEGCS